MFIYQVLVNIADKFHDQDGAGLVTDFRTYVAEEDEAVPEIMQESYGMYWAKLGEGSEYLEPQQLSKLYTRALLPEERFVLFVYDNVTKKIREAKYTEEGLDRTLRLIRAQVMKNTDFMFVEDGPIPSGTKSEWRVFRQKMRDITEAPYEDKVKMMKRIPGGFPTPPDTGLAWDNVNGPNPFEVDSGSKQFLDAELEAFDESIS
jgi:hypothetical protein